MSKNDPLEKDIEKAVCDHAKKLGCLAYKFTSPAQASVPDRVFILPRGFVLFVEFKRGGKEPTPAQAAEHTKIRSKGGVVLVIDEVKAGKDLITRWIDTAIFYRTPETPKPLPAFSGVETFLD